MAKHFSLQISLLEDKIISVNVQISPTTYFSENIQNRIRWV